MQTFSIDIPNPGSPEFADFQEAMNCIQDATEEHIKSEAKRLGISEGCAADCVYLRNRSRWTQAIEDKLIALHATGNAPNIFEYP